MSVMGMGVFSGDNVMEVAGLTGNTVSMVVRSLELRRTTHIIAIDSYLYSQQLRFPALSWIHFHRLFRNSYI